MTPKSTYVGSAWWVLTTGRLFGTRTVASIIMMTSNGNIFRVTGFCEGNSPVTGEFPSQRPVTHSFDVFFDLRLNRQLSKQSRRWWIQAPSRPLWRHCNDDHEDWSPMQMENIKYIHESYFCFICKCYNSFKYMYYSQTKRPPPPQCW